MRIFFGSPCVESINFGWILYPRKLLRSPILVGYQWPFLNTVNAKIDCKKQIVGVSYDDESHEFNFSKFSRKLHEKELPSKDELIGLASIAVPPTDPLEQYLLDHKNDLHMHERRNR